MKRNLVITFFALIFVSCFVFASDTGTSFNYSNDNYNARDINDLSFYTPATESCVFEVDDRREVKNVIFLIGDGMGLAQVSVSRMKALGPDGSLAMDRFPYVGIMKTHSANALVTDSAAAGTALACGFKTNNGVIGQSPDGKKYQNIFEAARSQQKMQTGLVATSTMSHATPAVFASHIRSRNMEAQISEQMVNSRINVMFGGGREFFLPRSTRGSKRRDQKDLISMAESFGYKYVSDEEQMNGVSGEYVLGLFQNDSLKIDGSEPTIAEMTNKAIQLLDKKMAPVIVHEDANFVTYARVENKEGFILMVEGSQIDWACHNNDIKNCIRKTLLFDQAVQRAVDFAAEDGSTLVIVTADHETGGLTIPGGSLSGDTLKTKWSTGDHSALPVIVYAFGPGAENFMGTYDNTDIPKKIAELLDIEDFPKELEN